MIHSYAASYKNVRVRPLVRDDIEQMRIWRNNQERNVYLRHVGEITPEAQEKWFAAYERDKDYFVFSIDEISELNRMVGSVALYNIRGKTAECGRFMVGDDPAVRGKGIGRLGITLCMYVGFSQMGFDIIDASVHEDNIAALTTDKKAGFVIVGEHPYEDGKKEWEMEARKDAFYTLHDFLPEVVNEGPEGLRLY